MIGAQDLLDGVRERGATMFTGVPCSLLAPLVDLCCHDPEILYVAASSETEAAGIASGAWLAGGAPIVICQNSGLGNLVNPLTSLAWPARLPFLILCTWRGRPGSHDEPQHELMGRITLELLATIDVDSAVLAPEPHRLTETLDRAWATMRRRSRPFCLIIPERLDGLRSPSLAAPRRFTPAAPDRHVGRRRVRRRRALARILELVDESVAIVATTGKTARELFELQDRPQHYYQVGAMGCSSAVGLGVALHTSRRVLVIDGDGAALMHMGAFATIGHLRPANLIHVVLDNGVHDSTGGQPTAAPVIDFAGVAAACGYQRAVTCASLGDFDRALSAALESPGPQLVHLLVRPGSVEGLGRPTVQPSEVARRFRAFLADSVPATVGSAALQQTVEAA